MAGSMLAGLVALSGCDSGGDDDTAGDTMNVTTSTSGADTGMDSTGADTTTGNGDISHDADIQPIWDEHCTMACHEPGGEWEFLDMSPGNAYESLVGVMSTQATDLAFVEPNDVNASYLWHKINMTQATAGGGGLDMPKARIGEEATMLSQEDMDTIEEWIQAGAPM